MPSNADTQSPQPNQLPAPTQPVAAFDPQGNPVTVDATDLPTLQAQGFSVAAPNQTGAPADGAPAAPKNPVAAYDQDDNPVTVDASDLPTLELQGYRRALPEEIAQEKYGDPLGAVAALGLGALGGETAGFSRNVIAGAGLGTPEEQAEPGLAHPVASFLGNALGFGGTFGAIEKGIGAALRGAGIVGEALQAAPLAEHVATGALAQAAYGAGENVSDQLLGDADFSAQEVLNSVPLNALVGGAAGGVLGLAGKVLPMSYHQSEAGLGRLSSISGAAFDKTASLLSGKPEEVFTEMRKKGYDFVTQDGNLAAGFGREQQENAIKAGEVLGNDIDKTGQEQMKHGRETLLNDLGASRNGWEAIEPHNRVQGFQKTILNKIQEALADRRLEGSKSFLTELAGHYDAYIKRVGEIMNYEAPNPEPPDSTFANMAEMEQGAWKKALDEFNTGRQQSSFPDIATAKQFAIENPGVVPAFDEVLNTYKTPEQLQDMAWNRAGQEFLKRQTPVEFRQAVAPTTERLGSPVTAPSTLAAQQNIEQLIQSLKEPAQAEGVYPARDLLNIPSGEGSTRIVQKLIERLRDEPELGALGAHPTRNLLELHPTTGKAQSIGRLIESLRGEVPPEVAPANPTRDLLNVPASVEVKNFTRAVEASASPVNLGTAAEIRAFAEANPGIAEFAPLLKDPYEGIKHYAQLTPDNPAFSKFMDFENLRTTEVPRRWGSEVTDLFKASDDFRKDLQSVVDEKGYERLRAGTVPGASYAALKFASELAHDAAEFTKDPSVWGDSISKWRDWQEASSNLIKYRTWLLKDPAFGEIQEGERVIEPWRFQRLLKDVQANPNDYSARLLDKYLEARQTLNDTMRDVYAKVNTGDFDANHMSDAIDRMNAAKAAALHAQDMGALAKEFGSGGRGFGLGRVGMMFYAARLLGVPYSGMAPIVAAFEALRFAGAPAAAIDMFNKVRGVVSRAKSGMTGEATGALKSLMGKATAGEATGALKSLTGKATAGARTTALDAARQYMQDRPFGGVSRSLPAAAFAKNNNNEDDFTTSTKEYLNHLRSLVTNPLALSATMGQSLSGLPPNIRNAAMMNAQARLNFLLSQAPPLMPAVGMGNDPTLSKQAALNFADVTYVMSHPSAFWQHFSAGTLKPIHVQAATIGWPSRLNQQRSVLHNIWGKLDTPASFKAQKMFSIAMGGTGMPGSSPNAFNIYQSSYAPAAPPEASVPSLANAAQSRGQGSHITASSSNHMKTSFGQHSGLPSDHSVA